MVNVRKFVGKTAREALAALKTELGPDAVVLSNRAIPGGVEIVALPAESMGELNATVRQARQPEPPPAVAPARGPHANGNPNGKPAAPGDSIGQQIAAQLARRQPAAPAGRREFQSGIKAVAQDADQGGQQMVRPFQPPRVGADGRNLPTPADMPKASQTRHAQQEHYTPRESYVPQEDERVAGLEAANAQLMHELASIRGMLERQLAGFAWSEISRTAPARTQMMSELLEAGFSAQITRGLTADIPADAGLADAREAVKRRIHRDLRLQEGDTDFIERGGIFALVGPTGVGKTTTTAKLAARCVVRHGADSLALITTDGYRIGAHEQLRIYGRILGVQVHVVRDAADLRRTLQDLRNKHLVLVDTAGMCQRDKMVGEQTAMLNSVPRLRRILCLNATSRGDTLDDVVRAYNGPDLAGCIFTKLDEAASLAPVLDIAMRHDLSLHYIANGQRVPEDLHQPNRAYLVHRALREQAADSPWKLDRGDAGLMMSALRPSESGRQGLPGA